MSSPRLRVNMDGVFCCDDDGREWGNHLVEEAYHNLQKENESLVSLIREVWESIPATNDREHAAVKRHAVALRKCKEKLNELS